MPREYPEYPIASVGVVVVKDNKVLLAQRGKDPARGRWTIPGGVIEVGETVHEAGRREIMEECNIDVEIGALYKTYDSIVRDAEGRVRFHYVILDVFGTHTGGTVRAGGDVSAVRWIGVDDLLTLDVLPAVAALVRDVVGGAW
ncbi:MAG: NUDIX hydrolase [Chloroflexi bacterium]|nr:NUDIX hydrolase [Chloroflexota bacterium]